MSKDKHLAVIVAGIALIIALSVATVAVAQNHIQQRECLAHGCVMWQNCNGGVSCPRYAAQGQSQGAGCTCAGCQ